MSKLCSEQGCSNEAYPSTENGACAACELRAWRDELAEAFGVSRSYLRMCAAAVVRYTRIVRAM